MVGGGAARALAPRARSGGGGVAVLQHNFRPAPVPARQSLQAGLQGSGAGGSARGARGGAVHLHGVHCARAARAQAPHGVQRLRAQRQRRRAPALARGRQAKGGAVRQGSHGGGDEGEHQARGLGRSSQLRNQPGLVLRVQHAARKDGDLIARAGRQRAQGSVECRLLPARLAPRGRWRWSCGVSANNEWRASWHLG